MDINVIITAIVSSSITSSIVGILLRNKLDNDIKKKEREFDATKNRHNALQESVVQLLEKMWDKKEQISKIMEAFHVTLISTFYRGFEHDETGRKIYDELQKNYFNENGLFLKDYIYEVIDIYGKHEHVINNLVADDSIKKAAAEEFMKCLKTDVFESDYYYYMVAKNEYLEGLYDSDDDDDNSEEDDDAIYKVIEVFNKLGILETAITNLYSIVCKIYNPGFTTTEKPKERKIVEEIQDKKKSI